MRFRKSPGDQVISVMIIVPFFLFATVECTNFFESKLQWGKRLYPKNGSLDYQPGLSLEDCISLCWKEEECKSVNYLRHYPLCVLNRVDTDTVTMETDFKEDTGSIYSGKVNWTEEEMLPVCSRRKRSSGDANYCQGNQPNNASSYCPDPEFNPDTEVVLGNLRRIGNNIRYACIIEDPTNTSQLPTIFPVGVSTCQENITWTQTWRPCQKTGKNYAVNKTAYQNTTADGYHASFAVDGHHDKNICNASSVSISHTELTDGTDHIWYVDLEEDVVVAEIVVYLRTDMSPYDKQRFQNVTFTVSKYENQTGSICAVFDGPPPTTYHKQGIPLKIKCQIPQVGRFVRVTDSNSTALVMCELEVYTKRGQVMIHV